MDKKGKKGTPAKTAKKRKCDGPTCTTFLGEIARRLTLKRKKEEELNVVQSIIDNLSNALPIKFTKGSPPKKESPLELADLSKMAPELTPPTALEVTTVLAPVDELAAGSETLLAGGSGTERGGAERGGAERGGAERGRRPVAMPLVNSDLLKRLRRSTADAAVNTSAEHDLAAEIARHVATLKKISLIAEEFNQKTARNLKDIVESVQGDLMKKLDEMHKTAVQQSSDVEISPRLPVQVRLS